MQIGRTESDRLFQIEMVELSVNSIRPREYSIPMPLYQSEKAYVIVQ